LSCVFLIDVRIEYGLEAVDDLRGADQQARFYISPVDAVELWTSLVKQVVKIKVLRTPRLGRLAATAL